MSWRRVTVGRWKEDGIGHEEDYVDSEENGVGSEEDSVDSEEDGVGGEMEGVRRQNVT